MVRLLHVGTFIGTLARNNEKLARFWGVGTHARRHVDHVGIPTRRAHDLENSSSMCIEDRLLKLVLQDSQRVYC